MTTLILMTYYTLQIARAWNTQYDAGCRVLVFSGTPTLTPGLENLGLQTPTPALKTWTLDSGPKIRLLTPTLGLTVLCDIMIVYLRMTW